LVKDGAAVVNGKGLDALALELPLGNHLLQFFHVIKVRTSHRLKITCSIVDRLPLLVRLGVVLERVEGHGPCDLTRRRLDDQLALVQMLDLQLEPAERLRQRDVSLDVEVGAVAFEGVVRLLDELYHHITSLAIWDLIALLVERQLVAVSGAFRDVALDELLHPVLLHLVPLAATGARLLHLLDHVAHADRADHNPTAAALVALLYPDALVDHLSAEPQLAHRAVVYFLKGDL